MLIIKVVDFMIKGYKNKKGLWRYLALLLLAISVFLVVILLLFAFQAESILEDLIFWLVVGVIIFLILILMFFQYLVLPKILLIANEQGIKIYAAWNKETAIPYHEILSIGLLPEPRQIFFPGNNLVIVTKKRGTYAVSFLQNEREIHKQLLELFNQYVVNTADIYFGE